MHRALGYVTAVALGGSLPASADTAPQWPQRPELSNAAVVLPARVRALKVYLDAGHGAEDNTGNRSAYCNAEEEFTLSLAQDVQREFERLGIETRLSRAPDQRVSYAERVRAAAAWDADIMLSLHSDIRGRTQAWSPRPGMTCLRSHEAPGFSVLFSDAGDTTASEPRRTVALRVSVALRRAGFLAYDGAHYGSDYAVDQEPGVFVDRHPAKKRIFMLHATSMPTVLIETHNALDDREVRLWESSVTRMAFARAAASALARSLD